MNTAVAIQPSRMQIPPAIAKEFEIQAADWRVLVEQIFPAAKSVEAVMMALAYCRRRNLDIFKKPVHIVPMWSSTKKTMVETVWPGIAEIRTTASRTGQYAGIDAVEFGPMIERTFTGQTGGHNTETITKKVRYPEWASVIVYKLVQGQKCAYHAKIFWEETYATIGKSEVPNDMWAKRARGQLDKCVEAAALRKAFPEELGSTYAAEEMEGRTIDHDVGEAVAATPKPPRPDSAPPKPNGAVEQKQPPKPANDQSELAGKQVEDVEEQSFTQEVEHDPETGEVAEDGEEALVPADPSEYLTRLETALEKAAGALDIEEIWNEMDLSSVFTHLPDSESWIGMAKKIRDRFLNKIKNPKGGAK